jgi:zinc protease
MRITRLLSSILISLALSFAAPAQQAPKPETKKAAPAKPAARQPSTSYKTLKYPPMNPIKVPEPVRFELANGMTVYLVEDHELPTITASAMIRAGSRWEPVNKAGLAAITGTVMRTGGAATRPGDQLDEELDRLGAYVETGIGEDSGRAMVSVLKEDIDKGLSILADLLQHPAFPQDKIDLAKIQHRDNIARRNDNPSSIAFREFSRIIFGKDTPYGHQTEYDTINSITRQDLIAFHKQFFQPENVVMAVWGDFKAGEMRALIERTFSGWARGGRSKPPVPQVDPAAQKRAGVYYINKEDTPQSWVLMGFLGGKRNDPDYYALSVMNTVLGGGFASRLFANVRSAQGLAYAVSSQWGAGWDRPGLFTALGSTKTETTVKILASMRHEIANIAEAGVTDDELTRAKDSVLKGFAFEFDSTSKIVQRLVSYDYYGYPRDYLQQYRANIEKVTKADVARVAKQYLKTDQLAILVVGKEKGIDQPLASLGSVTTIDVTIPKPKQEALGPATSDSIAKGKALLNAARQAMGGAAFDKVKDYTTVANFTVTMGQNEMAMKLESTINLSGRLLTKMSTPMGEMTQGYDGQTLWARTPQGIREMPTSQNAETEGGFFRDTISLLRNIDNPAYTVQALGPSEVQGKPAEAVAVADPARNLQVKLWIDPTTNLLLKKSYTAALMGPPAELEELYSDYRDAGGLKMPFKVLMNRQGQKFGDLTVTEIKINPGLDEAAYKKPQ